MLSTSCHSITIARSKALSKYTLYSAMLVLTKHTLKSKLNHVNSSNYINAVLTLIEHMFYDHKEKGTKNLNLMRRKNNKDKTRLHNKKI